MLALRAMGRAWLGWKMRSLSFLFALFLWFPDAANAADTSRLAFVTEYIRELGVNEDMRALAERELAEPGDKNATIIRSSTRIVLELTAQIGILKGMHLSGRFDALPGNIAAFYEQKIQVHNGFIAIATTFLSGPKADVDYGALMAEAPKLTARLDYIDRALFQASPLIFAALIDDKPDKQGHMSRLMITRAQRDTLVRGLQVRFGKKLDQSDQNFLVSSASILRDYLSRKGYACADEP